MGIPQDSAPERVTDGEKELGQWSQVVDEGHGLSLCPCEWEVCAGAAEQSPPEMRLE